jgi:hypothetical protein
VESPILDVFPYYENEEEAPLNEKAPEGFVSLESISEEKETQLKA